MLADTPDRAAEVLRAHGQAHVLDAPGAALSVEHLTRLPLDALLTSVSDQLGRARTSDPGDPRPRLEPVSCVPASSLDPSRAREAEPARARGEALLARGAVGVVVVAGGMGTRLGLSAPKGTFPVGPVSQRSIFELFAQRLRAARRRFGVQPPWAILTSVDNDTATRAFFAERDHFGLDPDRVLFFAQGSLPAFELDGRLALDAAGVVIMMPGGHGGVFPALARTGALEWLRERGVDQISYLQVDNPVAMLTDPEFLGHHAARDSQMSTKVVVKSHPGERVGVLAVRDGRVGVVEYTELTEEDAQARDADGALTLRAGNTAMHALSWDFARHITESPPLPFHLARKPAPVDPAGGAARELFKVEQFVFDALERAERTLAFEVSRALEFAPIKAPDGEHSPRAAARALSALTLRLTRRAGLRCALHRGEHHEHDFSELPVDLAASAG